MKLMLDGKYFTSLKFSLIFVCVDYGAVWIGLKVVSAFLFFLFFFFHFTRFAERRENESHGTIYTFKNYFTTVFSVLATIKSIQTDPISIVYFFFFKNFNYCTVNEFIRELCNLLSSSFNIIFDEFFFFPFYFLFFCIIIRNEFFFFPFF